MSELPCVLVCLEVIFVFFIQFVLFLHLHIFGPIMKTDIDTCNLISDRGWELEKYVIRTEKVKKNMRVRKIQVQNTAILTY